MAENTRTIQFQTPTKQAAILRRNECLIEIARQTDFDPSDSLWGLALHLSHEIDSFIASVWPSWDKLASPPDGASRLHVAIFYFAQANNGGALPAQQIHRILARDFVLKTDTGEKSTVSIDLARSIGVDCANEWIDRTEDGHTPASSDAWRARCFSDLVQDTQTQDDFLDVLHAWEIGFDGTLRAASETPDEKCRARFIALGGVETIDSVLTGDLPIADQVAGPFKIELQGKQAERFVKALYELCDVKDTLADAAGMFPDVDSVGGTLDPAVTVVAFTTLMEKKLALMVSTVDEVRKGGAA
jgi:hypothetical protein